MYFPWNKIPGQKISRQKIAGRKIVGPENSRNSNLSWNLRFFWGRKFQDFILKRQKIPGFLTQHNSRSENSVTEFSRTFNLSRTRFRCFLMHLGIMYFPHIKKPLGHPHSSQGAICKLLVRNSRTCPVPLLCRTESGTMDPLVRPHVISPKMAFLLYVFCPNQNLLGTSTLSFERACWQRVLGFPFIPSPAGDVKEIFSLG